MFKKYFKKLLGGGDSEVPANEQFYSPLRIGLHSTLTLDTIDWVAVTDMLHKDMKMPSGRMSVLAIGTTKVDSHEIFDIYLQDENSDEFILQIVSAPDSKGNGQEFVEGTFYHQVSGVTPLTEAQWSKEMKYVGDTIYHFADYKYSRVWSGDYDDTIELVTFNEHIIRQNETIDYVNNYMLYNREFDVPWAQGGKKPVELLLVGVEETEEDAELVHLVGLNIAQSSIHVQ